MAVTDNPISTRFDIRTLRTISMESPKRFPPTISGVVLINFYLSENKQMSGKISAHALADVRRSS